MAKSKFAKIMRALGIGTSAATLLFGLLYGGFQQGWLLTCAISFGTTAYHFVMRLVVGTAVLKLTDNRFSYKRRWFQPRPWETAFYKMLKVKSWKSSLPTYAPAQFSLRQNALPRVIENMCGAEVTHEIIMVLSFLPLLAVPLWGSLPVFLITSILSALFDSIFVIAQRFNRPRLVSILKKQEARSFE